MNRLLTRDTSWVDLVRARAERLGDAPAYIYLEDGETETPALSFADLEKKARVLGGALRRFVAPGDRVLLVFAPGPDFIVAFHACLFAGVIAVPTFPPEPRRLEKSVARLRAIVSDCRPRLAIGHDFFAPMCDETLAAHGVVWRDFSALEQDDAFVAHDARAEDLAFLQYTSGSTGDPRGVMVTHRNLLHNSAYIHAVQGNDATSAAVCWLPSYHDMGLIEGLLQPLYGGFRCFNMSPLAFLEQPRRWLQAISRFHTTNTGGPSFAYELCCRRIAPEIIETLDLSSLRVVYNGAEPIRLDTLERFYQTFAPRGLKRRALYPVYGLAEATLMVSSGYQKDEPVIVEQDGEKRVGAGRIGTFMQALIVDPDTRVPCDGVGEIWLSGESVAAGYYGRDEATRETFQAMTHDGKGPYLRTGDLGFLREDQLFVVGRIKDLVIVRGENHYPQDIEHTIEASHALVRAGCVAVVSVDHDGEEGVGVAAELKDRAHDADVEQAMRAAVSQRHGLDIARIRFLDPGELPKTSSGKLQRAAVRASFASKPQAKALAPQQVMKPWQRAAQAFVLQRLSELCERAPDLAQPATVLGLDSLEITGLKGELDEAFSRKFDIGLLIDADTLALGIEEMLVAADRKSTAAAAPAARSERASLNETAAWAWQHLNSASDALLVTVELRAATPIDRARFAAAFDRLRDRHDILRTRFVMRAGGLYREPVNATLDALQTIDLGARPPLSIRFVDERTLHMSFHHIGFDLDAVGAFVAELDQLYQDPERTLPPVAQASEWAAFQAQSPPDRARWEKAFQQPARGVVLPQASAAPRDATLSATAVDVLARRLEVTPFAVVLASIAGAFAQHGNHAGFFIGVSTSGRDARFAGALASFSHVVPVYVPPNAHTLRFETLVRTIAASLLAAIDRNAPAIRPIAELVPLARRYDLLTAVVHYRHLPVALGAGWASALLASVAHDVPLFGATGAARAWLGEKSQAPFELDVSAPAGGDLRCLAKGVGGGRILAAALDLLHGDPARTVAAAIAKPASISVPGDSGADLFARLASHAHAARTAIVYPGYTYTYAELLARAGRYARGLQRRGVGPGSRVALYLEPTPDAAMLLLGTWMLGATALLLATDAPTQLTRDALTELKPTLCVRATKENMLFPVDAPGPLFNLPDDDAALLGEAWSEPLVEPPPGASAVLYAMPKAGGPLRAISFGDLVTSARAAICTPADCVGLGTITADPAWVNDLVAALYVGARAYIAPILDLGCPGWEMKHMREAGVTRLRAEKFRARLFLNDLIHPAKKVPGIAHWVIDGGPLSADTSSKIEKYLAPGAASSAYSPPVVGREVTRAARVVAGGSIAVVAEDGSALPCGTIGRVVACGVVTDDSGWLSDDGELHLAGPMPRAQSVTIRGELVILARVQHVLRSVEGVQHAGVVVFTDARSEAQLAAFCVGTATVAEIRAATKKLLTYPENPTSIELVDALRFGADGLLDEAPEPAAAQQRAVPPKSESEVAVCDIFARVLGVTPKSISDDFFLLGGDSMLAVKLVDELWRAGLPIPLADLRECSTVGALAAKMDLRQGGSESKQSG